MSSFAFLRRSPSSSSALSKEPLLRYPTPDYFPPSSPAPSPLFLRVFSSTLLLIICQSLTPLLPPPLVFSLRCVWSLTTPPIPLLASLLPPPYLCPTAYTSFISLHVLPLFSLFITVACFIRPRLIKHRPQLPLAPPGPQTSHLSTRSFPLSALSTSPSESYPRQP